MDFEALREFLVYSKHMNYSRAAKELYIAQPTLSQHLARLEAELGFELVAPSKDRLTEAGEALLVMSQPLLREHDALLDRCRDVVERCRQIADQEQRAIRVLDMEGAISDEMPLVERAVDAYMEISSSERRPHVVYHRCEGVDALGALRGGDIDVAFLWGYGHQGGAADPVYLDLHMVALRPERCVALVRRDHPLAQGPVGLADVARYPVIVVNQVKWEQWGRVVENVFAAAGLTVSFSYQSPARLPALKRYFDYGDQVAFGTVARLSAAGLYGDADFVAHDIADGDVFVDVYAACLASCGREDVLRLVDCMGEVAC